MSCDLLKKPVESLISSQTSEGSDSDSASESDKSASQFDSSDTDVPARGACSMPELSMNQPQDWQLDKTLVGSLGYILSERRFSDISFVFPDENPDSCLPAHKVILAARSPFMEAMFYGLLASKKDEIEITNYSYAAFYDFVKYLYTDDIKLTEENASEVMRISHEYRVPQLTAKCGSYLSKHLTPNNVLDVLQTAELLGLRELEQLSMLYIDKEATAVLQTHDLSHLSRDYLSRIVCRDTLVTQEIHVYSAIVEWARAECERQGIKPTGPKKRELLGRIFRQIRMTQVTATQFADVVVQDELLSQEEMLALFKYFAATEKPKIEIFPNTKEREFPERILLCQRYDETPCPIKTLDEELSLQVESDCVLMGIILSKIESDIDKKMDVFDGTVTILNDGDEPRLVPFEATVKCKDDDTGDILLETPLVLQKDKDYKMILAGLSNAGRTRMGKFPAYSTAVGKSRVSLTQTGKRTTRSPVVGLLMIM